MSATTSPLELVDGHAQRIPVQPSRNALRLYTMLTEGRTSAKYNAIQMLDEKRLELDANYLRSLLVTALTQAYSSNQEALQDDDRLSDRRSWLLSALGRVIQDDTAARQLLIKHLDPHIEPNDWTRYWAMEGLYKGKDPHITEVARSVLETQHQQLTSTLASAILAASGDKESRALIENYLSDSQGTVERQWLALRALRISPVPGTYERLCEIVERAEYNDATFDAIRALRNVRRGTPRAERALLSVAKAMAKFRDNIFYDSMRQAAIGTIGYLGAKNGVPLLVDQLVDDNPAIVRDASNALERLVGARVAASRTIEAATESPPDSVRYYVDALRWMDRKEVVEELEAIMTTGPNLGQEIARRLLGEIGGLEAYSKLRARAFVTEQYTQQLEVAESKIREMFESTIDEARRGFGWAAKMDIGVFLLGLTLLALSGFAALFQAGGLHTWILAGAVGGTGLAGALYGLLVANPRRQISENVDHLMRLKVVFLSYLRQLHQIDQAFTRLLLEKPSLELTDVERFRDAVGKAMFETELRISSPSQRAFLQGGRAAVVEDGGSGGTQPNPN
jgi:HEAT repeat protein